MVACTLSEGIIPSFSPPNVLPCEICTYPSNGHHFKVASCRACAAFFRRSLVSGMKYTCRNGNLKCRIDSSERYFCKACRFEKCLRKGMCAEKIQQNRDPISSTIVGTSDCDSPPLIEDPIFKKPIFEGELYDFEAFLQEIRLIFSQSKNSTSLNSNSSALKEMENSLKNSRKLQKRRFLDISSSMDFQKITKTRLSLIKNCATFLMSSSFFQILNETEKLLILKSTWHLWARLERLTISVEIFEEKVVSEKIVFISDADAVYLTEIFESTLVELDRVEAEKVKEELNPFFEIIFDEVARKLVELKPTSMEITFMLWQLIWTVAEKILHASSLQSGEKFVDQLSTDLHNYYENELKVEKYAIRILKMTAIIDLLRKNFINIHKTIDEAAFFEKLFQL